MGTFGGKPLLRPPSSIINYASSGGVSQYIGPLGIQEDCGKVYSSGALDANTYKELISLTGAGYISLAIVRGVDATSRTMGLKVIVDGVTIFDAVSNTLTSALYGLAAIGSQKFYLAGYSEETPIPYYKSLSISIKSSNAETDKIQLIASYRTVASGFGISPLIAPPTSIVNYCSAGAVKVMFYVEFYHNNSKQTLSGALNANTYKLIYSASGAGLCDFCAVTAVDTTSRTVGLKVVVDGVDVFDAVSSAITATNNGLIAIGTESANNGSGLSGWSPSFSVSYNASLAIWVKSSLTETDKLLAHYNNRPS